jgi:effector-binding domain-containing protein
MTDSASDDIPPEIVVVEPRATMSRREIVPMSEIRDFFDRSFAMLAEVIDRQGLTVIGPAFARYRGEPAEHVDVEVGYETDPHGDPDGAVTLGRLPGGRVARTVHAGNYDELADSWDRLRAWIDQQGLTPAADVWEVYLTEPTPDAHPDDMRTELNWSVGD